MDRREFLSKIGVGAVAAITLTCIGSSCDSSATPTSNVDFNVDLTASANSPLASNGGYITNSTNRIVVAKGTDGNYYAATIVCAHEGQPQVYYNKSNNQYYCPAHGATYDLTGKATNNVTNKSLAIYKTTLSTDGKTLRVYSA